MIDESILTAYYSEIANKLKEMIPCEWTKIALFAEEVGNASFATFYFYTEDGVAHHYGDIPEEFGVKRMDNTKRLYELTKINKRLWLEFKNSDEEAWYTYKFELDSDWNFTIEYGYEYNENISSLEKLIRWSYDDLGMIPKERVEKKLLKEYLEEQGRELPEELLEI